MKGRRETHGKVTLAQYYRVSFQPHQQQAERGIQTPPLRQTMNKLKQDTCIQVRTKVGMTEVWGHQACALGKSLTQRSLKKMEPNIGKGGEVSSKVCVDSRWQKMPKSWEFTEAC